MKISIVLPSFNQNHSLERCLRSVWEQQIEDFELIVIDGGSTDGSLETIRRHAARLAHWTTDSNYRCAELLQEGFSHSHGDVMGWIAPDEMLTPWALRVVESVFSSLPEVEWITTLFPLEIDPDGLVVAAQQGEGYNDRAFYRGRNADLDPQFSTFVIPRVSTFWRRSLWERTGARVDDSLRAALDFDLWARFFQHAKLYGIAVPLGCIPSVSETAKVDFSRSYREECRSILRRYSRRMPGRCEITIRKILRLLPRRMYSWTGLAYPVQKIRQEGRGSEWIISREWVL